MTQLLTEVCARLPQSDTRHEDRSSSRSPPGAGDKRRKRLSVSECSDESPENESAPRRKSRREDNSRQRYDVAHLVAGPPVQATVTDKLNDGSEDETLKDAEG